MKSSRISALLAFLALAAGAVFLTACSSDSDSGSGSLDSELAQPGTLTVGSDIPFGKFEFGQAPDYKGFDIDLVTAIAKDLDLKLNVQDTAFDTIFTDTAQGKFDMAASAATITSERQQTVNFSDPYFEDQQALIVSSDSDIATIKDLTDKTVGAQDGTTGEAFAQDRTDAGSVRGFPNAAGAIDALKVGQVEAVIIDLNVAEDAVKTNDGSLKVAQELPTGELYGLVLAKKNTALLDKVNSILEKMKQDGRLNDLYQKWFKIDAPKSVIDGTTTNPGESS